MEIAHPPNASGRASLMLSPRAIAALAAAEHRARVRSLYIYPDVRLEASLVEALAALDLPALEAIEIAHFQLSAEEASALRGLTAFSGLRALCFQSCRFGASGMPTLAALPLLGHVSDLEFALTDLSFDDLKVLVASRHAPRWEALGLRRNPIGERGARLLARARKLGSLRVLDVSYGQLDASGVAALARAGALPRLERLNLAGNPLGDEGARVVAEAPFFPRLRALDLVGCGLGARGMAALSASRSAVALERLNLGGNSIGVSGIKRLAAAKRFANLRELEIRFVGLDDAGAEALAAGPLLDPVERLDLGRNQIGGRGAIALAGSPRLSRLRSLSLDDNPLSIEGAAALRASPWTAVREAARGVVPEVSASWPSAPARAALDAAWEAVAGLAPGDGAGAMRALVAKGVLPAALAHDERRCFRDEKVVTCASCGGHRYDAAGDNCHWCIGGKELTGITDGPDPPTVDRAVAFAADAAVIGEVSRLAWELVARLAPFSEGEPVQRLIWYFYRTPYLGELGGHCFRPIRSALEQVLGEPMGGRGTGWPLWVAHCWKEAASRDPQSAFATRTDPFEPYLAIRGHGYVVDVDAGAVVLMAPRPKQPVAGARRSVQHR